MLNQILDLKDPTQRAVALHAFCSRADFSKLSDAEKAVVTVGDLESEIMNGGFQQYFTNHAGNRWEEALHSLELVGAPRTAALMRESLVVFPDSAPSADHGQRQISVRALGDIELGKLDRLDQTFFRYEENLRDLVLAYAASHRGDFCAADAATPKKGFFSRLFGR